MDNIKRLVAAACLSLGAVSTHAGYAQLSPPERFSGAYPDFKFAPSANDARYGKIAYQANGFKVPVPGTAATMPAAYRFAANAPRVAAAAVFLSPHLRLAVGIAGWLGIAGIVWDAVNQRWATPSNADPSSGYMYRGNKDGQFTAWFSSESAACNAIAALGNSMNAPRYTYLNPRVVNGTCKITMMEYDRPYAETTDYFETKPGTCPAGWYVTPGGLCVQTPPLNPLSEPDFKEKLAPAPMPDTVPWELPFPTPLPVDPPFINPEPGTDPKHQPLFVPTGDPVPNPNYNPSVPPSPDNQPWIQPGTKVVPSPTPQSPLQVDLQPVNRPVNSPEPKPDPVRDPVRPPITPPDPDNPPDPNPPPDPDAPPKDKPKPEEQQSLCEKHPDILACAKTGNISAEPVKNENKTMEIKADTGYGPSNGTCPAPRTATVMGKSISMPFDLICQFADAIRPIVIGFAWLAAAMTFFGFSRRD